MCRTWQEYMDFSGFASTLPTANKAPLRPLTALWPSHLGSTCLQSRQMTVILFEVLIIFRQSLQESAVKAVS